MIFQIIWSEKETSWELRIGNKVVAKFVIPLLLILNTNLESERGFLGEVLIHNRGVVDSQHGCC